MEEKRGSVARFWLGSPVLVADLDSAAARWPGFVPEAIASGARAMFALPLQAGAIRVGVLSLYRALPGPLSAGELADVLVFADGDTVFEPETIPMLVAPLRDPWVGAVAGSLSPSPASPWAGPA